MTTRYLIGKKKIKMQKVANNNAIRQNTEQTYNL